MRFMMVGLGTRNESEELFPTVPFYWKQRNSSVFILLYTHNTLLFHNSEYTVAPYKKGDIENKLNCIKTIAPIVFFLVTGAQVVHLKYDT